MPSSASRLTKEGDNRNCCLWFDNPTKEAIAISIHGLPSRLTETEEINVASSMKFKTSLTVSSLSHRQWTTANDLSRVSNTTNTTTLDSCSSLLQMGRYCRFLQIGLLLKIITDDRLLLWQIKGHSSMSQIVVACRGSIFFHHFFLWAPLYVAILLLFNLYIL